MLCLAASESSGGSDLQIVVTEIRSERDALRILGRKKFVSLSPIADHKHQALRLRVADLHSRVTMLRHALTGIAARGRLDVRTASVAKVTAARLGEEVMGECMHIFGGSGYLLDETPLARWWRDMKLARVGGGADEVLWELVAAGMRPDTAGYRDFASAIS